MILHFKNKFSFFCFITCIILSFVSYSQNRKKADSLIKILEKAGLNKKEQIIIMGDIAFYHPKSTKALNYANLSYNLAVEINNTFLQARAMEEISHIERRLGNNEKSFNASLEALKIYESLGLQGDTAATYTQLANNYISDGNNITAIKHLKKALIIYKSLKKKTEYISTLLNLGEAYRLNTQLDSATIAFKRVLELNKTPNNTFIESYALGNLGMVYTTNQKNDLAKMHLNKAIKQLSSYGDYYSVCIYLSELGKVYFNEDDITTAKSYINNAYLIAKQEGLKEQIRDLSQLLVTVHESNGSFSDALKYQKIYQVYQDSLVNKKNIKRIEQVKAGYQINKRELEIDLLQSTNKVQKRGLFFFCIGSLLLLTFIYLLYKGKKIITQRETEKALLLKELNHRTKNNLQIISSLLNLQSEQLTETSAKQAIIAGQQRVEALSLVNKKLYQEGVETKIRLKEYIEDLVLGLFYAYDANFKPEIEIPDINISVETATPIALIINEMITNAIKYAYKIYEQPYLKIKVTEKTLNTLDIELIDNGIGFDLAKVQSKNSFGLQIINAMVKQLNGSIEKLNTKGTHWKLSIETI